MDECFSCFLNCRNGTKSRKAIHMFLRGLLQIDRTSLNCIEIEISRNKTLLGVILDAHIRFP